MFIHVCMYENIFTIDIKLTFHSKIESLIWIPIPQRLSNLCPYHVLGTRRIYSGTGSIFVKILPSPIQVRLSEARHTSWFRVKSHWKSALAIRRRWRHVCARDGDTSAWRVRPVCTEPEIEPDSNQHLRHGPNRLVVSCFIFFYFHPSFRRKLQTRAIIESRSHTKPLIIFPIYSTERSFELYAGGTGIFFFFPFVFPFTPSFVYFIVSFRFVSFRFVRDKLGI